jgi:glycosyltransferase involved in cell wall biosynthesis
MSRQKILVLSSSHLCRNPRVVKEAATLGAAGHDVTVMSVSAHPRFERVDLELVRNLPFERKVIDYSSGMRAARFASFVARGRTWAARALCSYLRIELAQSLGPASALLQFARAHPADLTIVHTEIPTWAAGHLLREGRRVAIDVEDWYSRDLLFADRRSRPIRLLQRSESFALRNASYASTTSESMAAGLATAYGCPRPIVVRNTFPLQARARTDRPPGKEPPAFIWFSQTIGPGRGLELFFAAWARTKTPSRVYLLGDERPGYREQLLSRLPAERRERVSFIPLVAPDDLPDTLARFDVGLALEPHWPQNRELTISNKIFQYMNAGLALVATETAGQAEVMRAAPDSGLLVQAHETTRSAALLDELVGNPERLRACQSAARAAALAEFCWEKDSRVLLEAVDRALTGPRRPSA